VEQEVSRDGKIVEIDLARTQIPEIFLASNMLLLSLLDFHGPAGISSSAIERYRIILRLHAPGSHRCVTWTPEVGVGSVAANRWFQWPEMSPDMEASLDLSMSHLIRILPQGQKFSIWKITSDPPSLTAHERIALENIRPGCGRNFQVGSIGTTSSASLEKEIRSCSTAPAT
jgi:hypothetical protein